MRTYLSILVLFLIIHCPMLSQGQSEYATNDNLYCRALYAGLKSMRDAYGHLKDNHDTLRVQVDYKNMIVEQESELCDSIPTLDNDVHVVFLDQKGLIEKYKFLKKEFPIIRLHPMKNVGNKLLVVLTLYWIKYESNLLNYAISDWCEVTFSYDCKKNKYIISNTKLGGV